MTRRIPKRRSTVPSHRTVPPLVPRPAPPARARIAPPPKRVAPPRREVPQPTRDVARILESSEASLLDLIDNLLNRGVLLHADLILSLAGVDLVYVRLSALLCAADRVLPRDEAQ